MCEQRDGMENKQLMSTMLMMMLMLMTIMVRMGMMGGDDGPDDVVHVDVIADDNEDGDVDAQIFFPLMVR